MYASITPIISRNIVANSLSRRPATSDLVGSVFVIRPHEPSATDEPQPNWPDPTREPLPSPIEPIAIPIGIRTRSVLIGSREFRSRSNEVRAHQQKDFHGSVDVGRPNPHRRNPRSSGLSLTHKSYRGSCRTETGRWSVIRGGGDRNWMRMASCMIWMYQGRRPLSVPTVSICCLQRLTERVVEWH